MALDFFVCQLLIPSERRGNQVDPEVHQNVWTGYKKLYEQHLRSIHVHHVGSDVIAKAEIKVTK